MSADLTLPAAPVKFVPREVPQEEIDSYNLFLQAKVKLAKNCRFPVDLGEINPLLKKFCRLIVQWSLKGGRRANFSSFGLHKTCVQLETMRLIGTKEAEALRLEHPKLEDL